MQNIAYQIASLDYLVPVCGWYLDFILVHYFILPTNKKTCLMLPVCNKKIKIKVSLFFLNQQ